MEIAALTIGLCGLASRSSQSRLTLAIACSRERLRCLCRWPRPPKQFQQRLMPAPLKRPVFSASDAVRAGKRRHRARSAASAVRARRRREQADLEMPPPAPFVADPRCFSAVDGNVFTSCRPSLRPTSRKETRSSG
jgi:hypothetical protein